jgi:hypothetical protein
MLDDVFQLWKQRGGNTHLEPAKRFKYHPAGGFPQI